MQFNDHVDIRLIILDWLLIAVEELRDEGGVDRWISSQ